MFCNNIPITSITFFDTILTYCIPIWYWPSTIIASEQVHHMCALEQIPTPRSRNTEQHSRWKQLILARDLGGHIHDASGIWGDRKSRETRMADRWPRKVSRSGLAAVKDLPVIYSFVPGPMGTTAAAAAAADEDDGDVAQHLTTGKTGWTALTFCLIKDCLQDASQPPFSIKIR